MYLDIDADSGIILIYYFYSHDEIAVMYAEHNALEYTAIMNCY